MAAIFEEIELFGLDFSFSNLVNIKKFNWKV